DKLVTGVQTCALPILRQPREQRRLQRGIDGEDARRIRADADESHLPEAEDARVAGEDLQRDDEDHIDEEVLDLHLRRMAGDLPRSEERRVGKECRYRW